MRVPISGKKFVDLIKKTLTCTGGTPKSRNLAGKSYKADLKIFGFSRSTNCTSFSVPELKWKFQPNFEESFPKHSTELSVDSFYRV